MSDKIQISWGDLNNAQVDAALKQQAVLTRAQQHVQQQIPLAPATTTGSAAPSILRSSLVYMTLFGLAGGILAWGVSEIVWQSSPERQEEVFETFLQEGDSIDELVNSGKITASEADNRLVALKQKYAGNPYVKAINANSSTEETKAAISALARKTAEAGIFYVISWFALIGCVLAAFIAIAEPVVSRNARAAVIQGSVGAGIGLIGGIVGGFAAGPVYLILGGGQGYSAAQLVARSVGWGILGLFLAVASGIVLRSWKRLFVGLAGGLLGGLVGGMLFDPLTMMRFSLPISHFAGITAVSIGTALATGLIEQVAKTGWLRVTAGLIAGKQFILYRNPTNIGSSPQCEIYLFKDPHIGPQHAAIHTVPGGFEIEDLRSGGGTFVNGQPVSRHRLRNGDQVQIGATAFVFQERARQA